MMLFLLFDDGCNVVRIDLERKFDPEIWSLAIYEVSLHRNENKKEKL